MARPKKVKDVPQKFSVLMAEHLKLHVSIMKKMIKEVRYMERQIAKAKKHA